MGNSVFTRVLLKEYCGNLALFSPSVFSSLLLYFLMMVGDFDPYTWWRIEEDLLIRDGEQIWIRVLRQILCSLHHGVGGKFSLDNCRMLCLVFMQIEWFVFIASYDELTPQMSLATSQGRQLTIDIIAIHSSQIQGVPSSRQETFLHSIIRYSYPFLDEPLSTCYVRLLIIQTRNYETLQLWTWFSNF